VQKNPHGSQNPSLKEQQNKNTLSAHSLSAKEIKRGGNRVSSTKKHVDPNNSLFSEDKLPPHESSFNEKTNTDKI